MIVPKHLGDNPPADVDGVVVNSIGVIIIL